jgi:hypothetical protein
MNASTRASRHRFPAAPMRSVTNTVPPTAEEEHPTLRVASDMRISTPDGGGLTALAAARTHRVALLRGIENRSKNNTNRERDDASPRRWRSDVPRGGKGLVQYERTEQKCHTTCDTVTPSWEAQPHPLSHLVCSNS